MTRYSQILFCRFFAPWSDFGIDVLEPDEHCVAAGARRLLDEVRDPVAQRVDLQDQLDPEAFVLAQIDQAVEDRLPIAVPGEIVVGDEIMGYALGRVGAHDRFDVVGGAVARLAALDVDDRAEAALERAAAAGVEARVMADHPRHHMARQHGDRGRLHPGHVMQVIVHRLRPVGGDVADELGHPLLGLARKKNHAQRLSFLQIRRQFRQHRYAARDMEPANHHRHACRPELARQIEGAGKLVRLNPDQPEKSAARSLYPPRRRPDVDDRVALVIGFDLDVDVGAESLPLGAAGQEPVDAGEAVRRDRGAAPLNHIAVVVVMRRLDEYDLKRPIPHAGLFPRAKRR